MIFTILIILFFILILFQKQLNKFQLINGIIIIACCLYYEQSEKYINYTCNNNSCKIYDITDLLKNEPDTNIVNEINNKLDPINYSGADSNFLAVDILVPCTYKFNEYEYTKKITTTNEREIIYKKYSEILGNNINFSSADDLANRTMMLDLKNQLQRITQTNTSKFADYLINTALENNKVQQNTPANTKIDEQLYKTSIYNDILTFLYDRQPNSQDNHDNLYFCIKMDNTVNTNINLGQNILFYDIDENNEPIYKSKNNKIINTKYKIETLKNKLSTLELFYKQKNINVIDTYNIHNITYEVKNVKHKPEHSTEGGIWNDAINKMWGQYRHNGGIHTHTNFNEDKEWGWHKRFRIDFYRSDMYSLGHDHKDDSHNKKLEFNTLAHKTFKDVNSNITNNDILILKKKDDDNYDSLKKDLQKIYPVRNIYDQISTTTFTNQPYDWPTTKIRNDPYGVLLLYENNKLHFNKVVYHGYNTDTPVEGFRYIFQDYHGWRHMRYWRTIQKKTLTINSFPVELIKKHDPDEVPQNMSYKFTANEIFSNDGSNKTQIVQDINNKKNEIEININNMLIKNGITNKTNIDIIRNSIIKGETSEAFNGKANQDSSNSHNLTNKVLKDILLNSENKSIKTIHVSKYKTEVPNQIRKYVILKM